MLARQVITTFVICSSLFATELQENFVPIRPLGMGGAFVGIANDENAIWMNPAGVARARKHRQRRTFFLNKFPNIGAGANEKARSLYGSYSSDKEKALAEHAAESGDLGTDTPYWAHVQAFPITMFDYDRSWPSAVGGFTNTTTKILIEESSPETARVEMISDVGGVMNLTWTNWVNRFSAGFNIRYIARSAYEDAIPTQDLVDSSTMQQNFQDGANQSTGLGIDGGIIYTFADFWFPTAGIAVLNAPTGCKEDYLNPHTKQRETVCGNLYRGNFANEDALSTVDPTDIRVGFSITPRITRKVAIRLAGDVHHLYATSGTQTIGLSGIEAQKLIHGGAELFIGNPLKENPITLRAGMNQGFITMGFSVDLWILNVSFATYGVDVSSDATPIEDRRMVGSFTASW